MDLVHRIGLILDQYLLVLAHRPNSTVTMLRMEAPVEGKLSSEGRPMAEEVTLIEEMEVDFSKIITGEVYSMIEAPLGTIISTRII